MVSVTSVCGNSPPNIIQYAEHEKQLKVQKVTYVLVLPAPSDAQFQHTPQSPHGSAGDWHSGNTE